jgi:hypothetical protein
MPLSIRTAQLGKPVSDSNALNLEDLQVAVHNALTSWGDLGGDDDELLDFLLIVRNERERNDSGSNPLALRQATNSVLESALNELAEQEETEAAVLKARFIEGEIIRQVAARLYASPDQVNRYQRSAISSLSQIILGRELALRDVQLRDLEAGLPPATYSRLFGFDDARRKVVDQLNRESQPWIVTIAGIGGIGKSSLADASVRRVLRSFNFDKAIWLQAGSHSLSGAPLPPEESYTHLLNTLTARLFPGAPQGSEGEASAKTRQILTKNPHLIVIDNLETEETTTYLIEKVCEWIKPTKFLFTTRSRQTREASAFTLSLDELSDVDAADLLRHQAQVIGLGDLAGAAEADLRAIYEVTGGNPLALKLVVSLASVMSLPQVLADLAQSRPGPIEDLYRYIYWESWRSLSEEARSLLQAMPLIASSGALPQQIRAISELSESAFWPAVSELISRSLLEITGTIHERRYGIHRLTETFLRTEIIGWSE